MKVSLTFSHRAKNSQPEICAILARRVCCPASQSSCLWRIALPYWHDQREGMGLPPEYKAMPSLHDVAHDGWLCTFTYITEAGYSISSQLLSGQQVRYGKGRRYGPSIKYKITIAASLLLQPARRAAVLAQPSSFGLIGHPESLTLCSINYDVFLMF